MGIQIGWRRGPDGSDEVWVIEGDGRTARLFALTSPAEREIVERWSAQAESLPEFLEMMHLEGLIDLDVLRELLAEHSPLWRIWAKFREFFRDAGDIGDYPAHWIMISSIRESLPDTVVHFQEGQVMEALKAWRRFEAGDDQALNEPNLGVVVAELGSLAGQRLGLRWDAAVHFGDWLCGLITGWPISHGNEEELWQLEGIAARTAAGGPQHIGPACYNPEVWRVYRPAIAAVVRALREEA
jgi:hypothetical protein